MDQIYQTNFKQGQIRQKRRKEAVQVRAYPILIQPNTHTIAATKPLDMYNFFDLRNHIRSFTQPLEKLPFPPLI